ncbi:hypothetical protein [uncultured Phocaeicola sp.]|uniref:hypothetical protein n=1 Tax=uncultured Phocaeicola sp. TaxID=990718 RepID=UPI00321F8CBB
MISSRPCQVMQGESEEDMKKYKIIFDDGNVRMLCALDQTYEDAQEIISRQISPECYEILEQEEQAEG